MLGPIWHWRPDMFEEMKAAFLNIATRARAHARLRFDSFAVLLGWSGNELMSRGPFMPGPLAFESVTQSPPSAITTLVDNVSLADVGRMTFSAAPGSTICAIPTAICS